AFSFNRVYPVAPNPILDIDGLGTVGLPLSVREAAAVKACAEQALYGQADHTLVDKSVRSTSIWEIDASKVRCQNRAWSAFMTQVVRDVCEVLAVDFQASRPRCQLSKLILYEPGSHLLPRVDTDEVNDTFATIVVVLPSQFNGGEVRVAHGELSKIYDNSAKSLATTSVLAWYTDVEHELRHITSGHRLALSFNLVHMTNSFRPTFSTALQNGTAARLRRVFLQWKRKHGEHPSKLIYLLSGVYSEATPRRSELEGVDADVVALLEDVGKPHGFHLGLASLTCMLKGSGGVYGRKQPCGWDSDSDYDDGDMTMEGVEETEVSIEHLTRLDGRLIHKKYSYLDHDLETEVIPKELVAEITSEAYDDQSYERERGNVSTSSLPSGMHT
ncbi:hypothetical protein K466DRAFT_488388, partial [Polyporus arcularius HHB13444]